MLQLTPQAIRLVKSIDDGENAKLFTFEAIGFTPLPVSIGQFFMLEVPGIGSAPFTYVELPDKHGKFSVLIRKVGKVTEAMFNQSNGTVFGYTGPLGTGWPVEELHNKQILIIAGGCGIAPLAACINHLIDNQQADNVMVIYGASTLQAQVLNVERTYWKSSVLLYETLLDSHDIEKAGTPSSHIARLLSKHNFTPDLVLTCGPEAMMKSVADTCLKLNIAPEKIWVSLERRMHCGFGLCGHCYLANHLVCKQGPSYRYDKYLALTQKTSACHEHHEVPVYC